MNEKPDIVVIHLGSNNITNRISEDFNVDQFADEIINIGNICRQYRVKDVIFSSIFVKNSIKLGKKISQVNETVTKNVKKIDSILSQIAIFCGSICVKMASI